MSHKENKAQQAEDMLAVLMPGGKHAYNVRKVHKDVVIQAKELTGTIDNPLRCASCYRKMMKKLQHIAWGYVKHSV